MYQNTTYTDHQGQSYPAVFLTWDQVEAVLGRGHDGTAEDDQELVEALIGAGAPDWVEEGLGWTDEQGWGLYRPQPLYLEALAAAELRLLREKKEEEED